MGALADISSEELERFVLGAKTPAVATANLTAISTTYDIVSDDPGATVTGNAINGPGLLTEIHFAASTFQAIEIDDLIYNIDGGGDITLSNLGGINATSGLLNGETLVTGAASTRTRSPIVLRPTLPFRVSLKVRATTGGSGSNAVRFTAFYWTIT